MKTVEQYHDDTRPLVSRLNDTLEAVRLAHTALLRLGEQARAEHGSAAFPRDLAWEDIFGDSDQPQRSCRLTTWRAWARRNGWLTS